MTVDMTWSVAAQIVATFGTAAAIAFGCWNIGVSIQKSRLETRQREDEQSRYEKEELRLDDVFRWANNVIRELQTLALMCEHGTIMFGADAAADRFKEIAINSSVLLEQGRILFKNKPGTDKEHDAKSPPAYRGYRPAILDYILTGHQIALGWRGASEDRRRRMSHVAKDCERQFVSLVQIEVGRSRTASYDTGKAGMAPSLESLLNAVSMTEEIAKG